MQRQGSFSQAEYAGKKKQTRRDKFLAEMEQVVPPAFEHVKEFRFGCDGRIEAWVGQMPPFSSGASQRFLVMERNGEVSAASGRGCLAVMPPGAAPPF
jgi:hypothetical protein